MDYGMTAKSAYSTGSVIANNTNRQSQVLEAISDLEKEAERLNMIIARLYEKTDSVQRPPAVELMAGQVVRSEVTGPSQLCQLATRIGGIASNYRTATERLESLINHIEL